MPACVTTCATARVEPEVNGLQLTIRAHAKPLGDTRRQDALAVAGGGDVIAARSQFLRQ
jgi:hypothetical protein